MRTTRRLGAVLLALAWTLSAPAAEQPPAGLVSIIIDDLGNLRADGLRALELPGPVTYAFLPHTPYAARLATLARHLDKEIMLHLPMESHHGRRLGPGGVTHVMDRATLRDTVLSSLRAVPHVRGVNNHMGSLLTRDTERMRWVMEVLREQGALYFIDSRTTEQSVAEQMAHDSGLESTSRDVFLDNDRHPDAIRRQMRQLLARARSSGSALGIGHPYPETLAVLEHELTTLASRGVRLVRASRLVRERLVRDESQSARMVADAPTGLP